jgi:hypothetical protein
MAKLVRSAVGFAEIGVVETAFGEWVLAIKVWWTPRTRPKDGLTCKLAYAKPVGVVREMALVEERFQVPIGVHLTTEVST